MAIASRRTLLPRSEKKIISPAAILVTLVILGLFIAGLWTLPILLGHPFEEVRFIFTTFFAISAVVVFANRFIPSQLQRIAKNRQGESICTFARAFDFHQIDTRIIRAVYEEIQHGCEGEQSSFPVRPSDRWYEELGLMDEDLEDIAQVVAFRTRRSLENPERNPKYGKIKTVADLVQYLTHQVSYASNDAS